MKDMIGLGDISLKKYEQWLDRCELENEMLEAMRFNNWVMTPYEWETLKRCIQGIRAHLHGEQYLDLRSLNGIIEELKEIDQLNFSGEACVI